MPRAGTPFAYLFERFPAFSQTFCYREALEMRMQGVAGPIFSIRRPEGEPHQEFPGGLLEATTYLPARFDECIRRDAGFRRGARRGLELLRATWGDDTEKRRIYEALWLARECRKRGVTHVHAHFANMATRTAYWLKRLAGVRYSFTAHANDVFCDEPSERLEMLIAEAEFVATETEFSARYLRELFPRHAAKVHRVFNGIDLSGYSSGNERVQPPRIVSVGRYIEKKGYVDLIAACAGIREIPFECHIVGQGPLQENLTAKIRDVEMEGRIFLTGPRTSGEIAALLSTAAIFALPSVRTSDGGQDNLPTVIMEAMASGLPVVSTPIAGIPEMIEDGVTGYLVPEHDPVTLARRIAALLANPDQAREMGAAARKRCERLFSTKQTTTVLRQLLEAHGAFTGQTPPWWRRLFS